MESQSITGSESGTGVDPENLTREAALNRGPDGEVVGAGVFITAAELQTLGVDVAAADSIGITIQENGIRVVGLEETEEED